MRVALIGLAMLPGAAAAQVMPCSAPAPFYSWARPATLVAGAARENGFLPGIIAGRTMTLTLAPTGGLRPELPAKQMGEPVQYGGMVTFIVPAAGTYRVGIDAPAWIEVGTTGRAVASIAHGHGAECEPVRKMVDYRLAAGTYVLQITAAADPVTTVAVMRLP